MLQWAERWRVLILVGAAALVAVGYNGQWRLGPDSAVHVIVARSLAAGEGFVHPGGRQEEIEPGLAYVLGAVFAALGPDAMGVANAAMAAVAVLALLAAYALMSVHGGRGLGALVVLLLAVNETFYRYAHQLLADMPFLLGAVLALLGLELGRRAGGAEAPHVHAGLRRGRVALALLCVAVGLGVMAAFRSVAVVFVAALGLAAVGRLMGLWCRGWWPRAVVVGVVALGAALWLAKGGGTEGMDEHVIGVRLGAGLGATLREAATVNLPRLLGEVTTESVLGVDMHPLLAAPLAVWVWLWCVGLGRARPVWGLLFAAFGAQWLLFVVTDRYFLPLLPLVALAWWRGAVWLSARWGGGRGGAAWAMLAVAGVLWVVPNAVKEGDFVREQRARPFVAHYEKGKYEPVVELGRWAQANTGRGAVFVTPEWMAEQLTAVSGRWSMPAWRLPRASRWTGEAYALPTLPEEDLRRLRRRGWLAVSDEPYAAGVTRPPVPVLRLIPAE